MGKILGSWSGMRKYLEEEMLAESLKGRIKYSCTSYAGMDRECIFDIRIDGKQVKRFSWETVNTYFNDNGLKTNKTPFGEREHWEEFWILLNKYSVCDRDEYTDGEFCNALESYRSMGIQESIFSENPLIRMFAIFDRRLGKRTLLKLKDEIHKQPLWLQEFYELRISTEMS